MIMTYNGKKVSISDVKNKIVAKIESISSELFRKYVENFVKNLAKSRRKARKHMKEFLRLRVGYSLNGGEIPNMFSGQIHGNSRRYNMLENIVYDRVPPKVRIGKTKAKIMIPYGIDTDGSDNLVKNKKGVAYAQILDKWNGTSTKRNVPNIKRFNGFIGGIKEYYRGTLIEQLERDLKDSFQGQLKSTYKF